MMAYRRPPALLSPSGGGLSRRDFMVGMAGMAVPVWADAPLQVVHQGSESATDTRNDYYWQILDAALAATRSRFGPYQLSGGPFMNGPRALKELQMGTLNIIVRSTGPELEQNLRTIRVPLDKGLLGFRVFLIRREMQAKLDQVRSLADLQQFSVGQARGWNDVPILESAGFKVVGGGDYEGLFGMLISGRFDLFSRGVLEAVAEVEARQTRFPDLTIENKLMLYYPLPRYLFVRRDAGGELLAGRIEQGLEAILADGTFDRLFERYRTPVEQALGLRQRRLFRIPNPTLSAETPLQRRELWYDPTGGASKT